MESKDKGLINQFKTRYMKMWWDTPATFPRFDKVFDLNRHIAREKDMNTFIDRIILEIRKFPSDNEEDCAQWGARVRDLIRRAGNEIIGLTDGCMRILLNGGFSNVTSDFISKAREFDSKVRMDDIMQAMRNVWIMNSIQLLLEVDVQYTPSLFAYSMLYPYTDNYLDTPNISFNEKKEISARFRMRLEGKPIAARDSYEASLFKLVGMVEDQYPRASGNQVYASLLSIHDAQQKSLLQQYGNISPYEMDIMGISFEKGGTSVLTDAYLAKYSLKEAEGAFMFGFGIFLQLVDDAQDAKTDMKNGHMTMFSQTAEKWPLDNITNRLFNFTYGVLDTDDCFSGSEKEEIKDVIKKNCTFLLLGAIAHNRGMYSKSYIEEIEKYCPFSFHYMRHLYKRIGKEYGRISKKIADNSVDVAIAQALT